MPLHFGERENFGSGTLTKDTMGVYYVYDSVETINPISVSNYTQFLSITLFNILLVCREANQSLIFTMGLTC